MSVGEEVKENKSDIDQQCVRIKIAFQLFQFGQMLRMTPQFEPARCAAAIWREKFEIVQACLPEPHKGVQNPKNVQNGKSRCCDLREEGRRWPHRQDTDSAKDIFGSG